MTDLRRPPMPFFDAAPPGCRWCGVAEGAHANHPGREYAVGGCWHDDCLTAYAIAVSSKAQRFFVEKRDFGLCVDCGANREHAEARRKQALLDAKLIAPECWEITHHGVGHRDRELRCKAPCTWIRPGIIRDWSALPAWVGWEADHIVPLWSVDRSLPWPEVIRFWSLENLQTLCAACHKRKCAAEAAERAAIRRGPSPQMSLFSAEVRS